MRSFGHSRQVQVTHELFGSRMGISPVNSHRTPISHSQKIKFCDPYLQQPFTKTTASSKRSLPLLTSQGQFSGQNTMVWPFSQPPTPEAPKEPEYSIKMPERIDPSPEAVAIRRRKISEAIQENCALDQAAFVECQQQWNIWSKLTLCQHFQHRYYDCQKAQRVSSPVYSTTIYPVDISYTNGIRS